MSSYLRKSGLLVVLCTLMLASGALAAEIDPAIADETPPELAEAVETQAETTPTPSLAALGLPTTILVTHYCGNCQQCCDDEFERCWDACDSGAGASKIWYCRLNCEHNANECYGSCW